MITELEPKKMVHKYPFSLKATKFSLHMPKDFKFLAFAFQNETPCVWVEVTDVTNRDTFNFQLFGTGHEIPLTATWLTTFTFGPYVYHLYRI